MAKHFFLSASLLLAACSPAADQQITDEPSPEGNVGASCTQHSDCETPMDYLIRSHCPFTSQCIQGSCAVVCPMIAEEQNPDTGLNEPVQCETDSDCDCSAYAASDMIRCACTDGACAAVMEE